MYVFEFFNKRLSSQQTTPCWKLAVPFFNVHHCLCKATYRHHYRYLTKCARITGKFSMLGVSISSSVSDCFALSRSVSISLFQYRRVRRGQL